MPEVIDLAAALRVVARALDELAIAYMVVGSTAASAWGLARATRDVDLVMSIDGGDSTRHHALLAVLDRPDLYVPIDEAEVALMEGGTFNVLHPSTGGKVDVFVARPDDEFEMMRLARRTQADVLGEITWVATPEDVILAKLRWRLESRSEVQWTDCVAIAATQALDVDHLTLWAPRIGVTDDLEELLTEVNRLRPPSDGGVAGPNR